jgi:hypothetical protein
MAMVMMKLTDGGGDGGGGNGATSAGAGALTEDNQTTGLPPVAGDLELEPDLAFGFGASPQPAVVPRGVWRVAAQLGAIERGSGPLTVIGGAGGPSGRGGGSDRGAGSYNRSAYDLFQYRCFGSRFN